MVKDLLVLVYREIGSLESLRRQKAMVLEDNAGLKAIRYDSEKVCGGGGHGDLTAVLETIEEKRKLIDELITRMAERIMTHREELYKILSKVPESPGKAAVEEHYMYRVPWIEVARRLHYDKDYIRKLAEKCINELEEIRD